METKIALIHSDLQKLIKHFKLDRRAKTDPEDTAEPADGKDFSQELKSSFDKIEHTLGELRTGKRDSTIVSHRLSIDIKSSKVFISLITLSVVLFVSIVLNFNQLERNLTLRDNDLKYRYIQMRGAATPADILQLRTIFDFNPNTDSIKLIRRRVVRYERLVKEQAERIEQSRLNASEARRLQNQAETVKEGR